jgi:membrane-associated phospholipid phosphatase
LRAIDPDAAVERGTAVPESSDLRVAPFVGSERRVPEGGTGPKREQRRDDGSERRRVRSAQPEAGTIALAAGVLGLLLALTIGVFDLGRSPDRYALLLLVPALVLRRGRRYLLNFLPFVALIVVYAECRGLAHVLRPDPYFTPHLDLERQLFGGSVPASVLQEWFWSGHERWHDTVLLGVSRIHQFVPLTLAFVLLMRRRALFYRFAATLLVLSFSAALTFLLYPAAPPWHAAEKGLLSVEKLDGDPSSRAATSTLTAPYDLVHPNPDAAIPSLHGGYAFLVFLFVSMLFWRTRWRVPVVCLAALYVAVQSFAAVYTGNHYVVDLLIGYGYAAAALVGVSLVWRRLRLPAADSWSDERQEAPEGALGTRFLPGPYRRA